MGRSQIDLLAAIVDRYDQSGQPVKPEDFARTPTQLRSIRDCFEDFESKYLLAREDGYYRPTVTARELLELDIGGDELLLLDCDPEE